MARIIKVDRGMDGEAVIVVTEPQETRYTLDQAERELEMSQGDVEMMTARRDAAAAKVAEAKTALGGFR